MRDAVEMWLWTWVRRSKYLVLQPHDNDRYAPDDSEANGVVPAHGRLESARAAVVEVGLVDQNLPVSALVRQEGFDLF